MSRWLSAASAAAICTYITVVLWAERTGGHALHVPELATSLVAIWLVLLTGWLAAGRLTGDRDRRGFITLVFGVWALAFGTFHVLAAVTVHTSLRDTWLAAMVWTLLCAAVVLVLGRTRMPLSFAARVLAITAAFLVGREGVAAVTASGATRAEDVRASRSTLPDVYVIVLDKYSSGAWLRHSYGLDQSVFEDSLRRLGFVVPRAARANYAHTQLALASFLNWKYIEEAPQLTWGAMGELVRGARAWEAFRDHGYRIVTFPTTFSATRSFPAADVQLSAPAAPRTWVPLTLLANSPLVGLASAFCLAGCRMEPTPYPVESLDAIEWKLSALATLPDSAGPVFAFLHLLAPHEPYLFDSDCSARRPWWPIGDQGAHFDPVGEAYANQVRCMAPLLLKTITRIVERSTVPPVIVLQSDHGHGRIALDPLRGFTLTEAELSAEQLGDRLGVFAAYRFPRADSLVSDDISPVNVLPLVLAGITGATATLQPDRSFWSSYQSAFAFEEVAADRTRPPPSPHRTRAASR